MSRSVRTPHTLASDSPRGPALNLIISGKAPSLSSVVQGTGNESTLLLKTFHPCSWQEHGTDWEPTPRTDSKVKRTSWEETLSPWNGKRQERAMGNGWMDATKMHLRYTCERVTM